MTAEHGQRDQPQLGAQGLRPARLRLVAVGGGGPLYGVDIARERRIPRVIVPPHPGITSALGLLASDVKYELAAP